MGRVIFLNPIVESTAIREVLQRHLPPLPTELDLLITFDLRHLDIQFDTQFRAPTLLLNASEGFVSVGPLHVPGQSVCFSCLYHWITTTQFDQPGQLPLPGEQELRFAAQAVKNVITVFAGNGEIPELRSAIHTFELATDKCLVHPIYPLSDCRTCGDLQIPDWPGLRIHCSSLTGIVHSMEITSDPVAGTYHAIATWTSPLPQPGKRSLLRRQDAHGRGITQEQAELGCIGEALERYSLIYRGDEPLLRARVADIQGVDPREILLYSEQQYRTREEWNCTASERYFVGEPFDPERPIEWFPATDLIAGQKAFVPAACTLMWYPFQAGESEFALADTIGCGSAWTLEDALVHALLEWIERDAVAIWWYNRIHRPAVCLSSFEMPELQKIQTALRKLNRDLVLLDCTTDVGIPAYVCVSARLDGTEPLFASAASISPKTAAWKAAAELGQIWFTSIHTKRIDVEIGRWLVQTTATQPYLTPTHEIEAAPEPLAMTSAEQVRYIVKRLLAVGLTSYAADLSRSDVLLKTVRAVVPGLRHVWNRRAPGRLYDVPVRLGWLSSPLTEDELNSICCMI